MVNLVVFLQTVTAGGAKCVEIEIEFFALPFLALLLTGNGRPPTNVIYLTKALDLQK
jgi:hypothetical protein